VIDERGTVHYANPSAEKMTGYSKSELAGKNVRILMPEVPLIGRLPLSLYGIS